MTLRAALYARFSSDLQRPESLADQLAAARRLAAQLGAVVVADYSDAAISGASMANRPGLGALMAAAKRGAFDVVVAEAMDRLTRSGGDAWDIFEDLKAAGVRIHTVSEGDVSELHVGLKGTMNALFLRELGLKVRRGLRGVSESGRHTATPPYGYRAARVYDAGGERIRGVLEIVEPEAAVVRRIAGDVIAGLSGQAIAHRLNAEGVPGPRGGAWEYGAIIGRPGALRGLLRNPLYRGELVWNRERTVKDRRTGKVRHLKNPPEAWIRTPVPDLAILDAATAAAVDARIAARAAAVAAAGNPSAANAPRRLLSGLVRCGTCGGAMNTMGPQRRYRCLARMRKGLAFCANNRTAPADQLEAQVLADLRRDLLHPVAIETFVREFHAAQRARGAGAQAARAGLERERAEVRRRAERLVDQVADGILSGPTVKARLAELEARAAQLDAELGRIAASAEVVTLNPRAAGLYRQIVEDLAAKLDGHRPDAPAAELAAARAALRKVVTAVIVHPEPERGRWRSETRGDLTRLLELGAAKGKSAARA